MAQDRVCVVKIALFIVVSVLSMRVDIDLLNIERFILP